MPSEMTDAEYNDHLRDYACFTFEPDFFALRPSSRYAESRYVSVEIDEAKFWRDVNEVLRKQFGPGVAITFREGCHEFEVIRQKAETAAA